ncbi:hypothetical protein EX30DRAFT_259169 [Ascodesmis nigricans]|uniref:Uncharacterized protein n=1 Tax=Ascodesmis nigricans TaxID=341454 RepID=A0A4S2MXC9_9PEZI|nr:hypothetical protein EX30DRAFT_259169 [Ascodesmis nigricans]
MHCDARCDVMRCAARRGGRVVMHTWAEVGHHPATPISFAPPRRRRPPNQRSRFHFLGHRSSVFETTPAPASQGSQYIRAQVETSVVLCTPPRPWSPPRGPNFLLPIINLARYLELGNRNATPTNGLYTPEIMMMGPSDRDRDCDGVVSRT